MALLCFSISYFFLSVFKTFKDLLAGSTFSLFYQILLIISLFSPKIFKLTNKIVLGQ